MNDRKEVSAIKNKSEQIFKWIENRHKHYDKIEGKYCGDKYSDKIFSEASKLFKMTPQEVQVAYTTYVVKNVNEMKVSYKLEDELDRHKNKPELYKATKLHNKKVKLDVDAILSDDKRSNVKYKAYVENSRDKTFTAVTDEKSPYGYTFKEDDTWIFFEDDLIQVE